MSWARVQGTGANNVTAGLSTTLSATFVSSVTAGNLIVVGIGTFSNGTLTIKDSVNNTNYAQAVSLGAGTNNQSSIWSFVVPSGGGGSGFAVTLTGTTAGAPGMAIDEFSYSGTGITVDAFGTGSGTSTAIGITTPGTTLTPTGNDLIYAVNEMGVNATFTHGAGFTQSYQGTFASGKSENCCTEYALNQSSVITPAASLASINPWIFVAAAFQPTGLTSSGGAAGMFAGFGRHGQYQERISRRRFSRPLR